MTDDHLDREMMRALQADGEKLRQLTGEDHGPWEIPPQRPPADDDVGRDIIEELKRTSCTFDHPDAMKKAREWMTARIAQSETRAGAAAPEGWQLVPVVPDANAAPKPKSRRTLFATPAPQRTVTVEEITAAICHAHDPACDPDCHDCPSGCGCAQKAARAIHTLYGHDTALSQITRSEDGA